MEEETEKMYEDIVKFCRENHTSFVDYQFPPNDRSLGEVIVKKLWERYKIANVNWLRPNQIVTFYNNEDKWSVFNDPQPSDVVQSRIFEKCSLIAALSVIAERPDILDNIFPSKEYSPEGVYRVRLYINGQWKTIIVDDYLPCFVKSNQRATAFGKRKQLWVSLIEKALAKQFGSYSMFEGGAPARLPLSILTGSNCIYRPIPKNPDDIDLFWNALTSAKSSNFLICCGSPSEPADGALHDTGVVYDHSYSILDFNDDFGNRLLLLRNPWGRFEWSGKWSKFWDGRRSSMIADKAKENGVFWIELDDFMNKFNGVTICRIRPTWHQFRYELIIGLDTSTVRLTVTETCEASFAIHSERSPQLNTLADMMVSIHRISKDNIIGDMIGRSSRRYCYYKSTKEILLTPGQYIIILFDLQNLNKTRMRRVVVCYSSKPIFHELVQQTPQMFNHALREVILKDGDLETCNQYGIFIRFLMDDFQGMIIMADNFLQSKYLHFSLECSESKSVYSSRNSLKTIDIVPPMSYQIITIITPILLEKNSSTRESIYNTKVRSIRFIGEDDTDDEEVVRQNLQHYPVIDPLDPIHYPQSIFYDSVPIEVETTERKCQKRIKHFLRKCDCRT